MQPISEHADRTRGKPKQNGEIHLLVSPVGDDGEWQVLLVDAKRVRTPKSFIYKTKAECIAAGEKAARRMGLPLEVVLDDDEPDPEPSPKKRFYDSIDPVTTHQERASVTKVAEAIERVRTAVAAKMAANDGA